MREFWFGFVLLSFVNATFGQGNIIQGEVLSFETRKPIPFANVSILNTNNGTSSGFNGYFSLERDSDSSDSLRISAVGFEEKRIPIPKELGDTLRIYLNERTIFLEQVVIESKKYKRVEEGKLSKNPSWGKMKGENGGAQFARKFKNEGRKVILENVKVLAYCNSTTARMRLRIYNIQGDQEVDLLNENVFVEIADTTEWVTVDLWDYGLETEQDFLVGFEWLTSDFKCPYIGVGGVSPRSYFRLQSHGEWQISRSLNWAIRASLLVVKD